MQTEMLHHHSIGHTDLPYRKGLFNDRLSLLREPIEPTV
jgi:hypothetical protein